MTETVTQTVTAAAPTPAPVEATETASCASTPITNPLNGTIPIPVRFADYDFSDSQFYYTPKETSLDSCVSLNWVLLSGTTGVGKPGATSGSFHETVALIADGRLITDPAPILGREIASVDRIDDSTIRVNYLFYNDKPAAAGDFTPGSATFHWDGTQIIVSDNTLPLEQNEIAETLDLSGFQ